LTEETDAVVVAVSEETGAISYAYKGQLVRNVTAEALRSFLTSVLVTPVRSRNLLGRISFWKRKAPAPASPVILPKDQAPASSGIGK
jgi:diadenylate cyclase